jgi:hypothetical protein
VAVVMAVGRVVIVGVAVTAAVVVAVAVLVVPVAHGGPLPVRGSGRVGVHGTIMCV